MQTIATIQPSTSRWKLRSFWLWSLALACLILVLYGPVLASLVSDWWTDPDYGHGFFIPLFSAYVLYRERTRWEATPIKPSNFGLLVILGAICLFLIGSLGAELFTARFSLLMLLSGMVLFLLGWKMLRAVAFPLGFLILMIPLPNIIYNQITFPLQLFASRSPRFASSYFEFPVLREGNILWFSNYSLEVVEACSGNPIFDDAPLARDHLRVFCRARGFIRYALVLLMVPIAVVSKRHLRIMGAGLMARHFGAGCCGGVFARVLGMGDFRSGFAAAPCLPVATPSNRSGPRGNLPRLRSPSRHGYGSPPSYWCAQPVLLHSSSHGEPTNLPENLHALPYTMVILPGPEPNIRSIRVSRDPSRSPTTQIGFTPMTQVNGSSSTSATTRASAPATPCILLKIAFPDQAGIRFGQDTPP